MTPGERGIIFQDWGVRAILGGRKTQTRRIIRPQPEPCGEGCLLPLKIACPYGRPGDLLWVRETWREPWSGGGPAQGYKTGVEYRATWNGHRDPQCRTVDVPEMRYGGGLTANGSLRWRPSIHMPRWASRLTLRLTEVRVQRVQEISEEDARAEGIKNPFEGHTYIKSGKPIESSDVLRFKHAWDAINGKRPGCSWEANPWVWALSFEPLPAGGGAQRGGKEEA